MGVAAVIALLATGWSALPAAALVALAGLGLARLTTARIGGQTGDVLGAAAQLAEIATLVCLAASVG